MINHAGQSRQRQVDRLAADGERVAELRADRFPPLRIERAQQPHHLINQRLRRELRAEPVQQIQHEWNRQYPEPPVDGSKALADRFYQRWETRGF
jgi:hypothetical protein